MSASFFRLTIGGGREKDGNELGAGQSLARVIQVRVYFDSQTGGRRLKMRKIAGYKMREMGCVADGRGIL